jgi:hypothetical protein
LRPALRSRLLTCAVLFTFRVAFARQPHNKLTSEKKATGWILLFDGTSMRHLQDPRALTPPDDAWTIAGEPRKECVITLQNHGDEAWFRDIKIRRF